MKKTEVLETGMETSTFNESTSHNLCGSPTGETNGDIKN